MADHAGEGVAHHPASGCRQDQEERTQQLGEEASPLLPGIVEVTDPLDDALLVTSDWTERGNLLCVWLAPIWGLHFSHAHGPSHHRPREYTETAARDCWISRARPSEQEARHGRDADHRIEPTQWTTSWSCCSRTDRSTTSSGRLYGPDDGKTFEGVVGKDLSNPIPEWAEHGADRKVVPYGVATDMDSPNPDSGEEFFHTNTQLFNTLDDHNRFKIGEGVSAPWNAPPPGATPTMDGFVTDYISTFTGEVGRQPTYDEYAQIMTGYTPEQLPVLSGIARDFGVFDHWFSEVPSQTFMNRSFWTAATSSGLVVNSPATKWMTKNTAETIFERLEAHGKTWKVYVCEPMPLSFTGVIHFPRLQQRLATHFVPFSEFEKDAAAGTLPDFSLIEPDMASGHNDYHPALSRSMIGNNADFGFDPPSSLLGGEAFLERLYDAYRSMTSPSGTNVWNTALLIGWDEPGGTYDHVAPGPVPPPDAAAPVG